MLKISHEDLLNIVQAQLDSNKEQPNLILIYNILNSPLSYYGQLTTSYDYSRALALAFNALTFNKAKWGLTIIKALLDAGAPVDSTLYTPPLCDAAENCLPEIVALLLEKNADIHVTNQSEANTPLHLAAQKGSLESVELLLKKGAQVQAKNSSGETSLHLSKNAEITALLLAYGANINAKDNIGKTPLHCAVRFRNEVVVQSLLTAGADVTAQDNEGETALDRVLFTWHSSCCSRIIKMLLGKGATHVITPLSSLCPLQVLAGVRALSIICYKSKSTVPRFSKRIGPRPYRPKLSNPTLSNPTP